MKEVKQLTYQQALEQGYTLCGHDGYEYQSLADIQDLTEEEIEDNDYVLAEKESFNIVIPEGTIKDFLKDYLFDQDEIADDTGELEACLDEVDFKDIEEKVNNALAKRNYWKLTDIKLVVENQEDEESYQKFDEVHNNFDHPNER